MTQPQQQKTFAQELSELEVFDVLHSNKSGLDVPSFRKIARTKVQSLEDAAKRETHPMALTDMKRLVYCCSSLSKTIDLKDVNEGRGLWGLVEAAIVTAAGEAAEKSPINRLEDLAEILSVLNTTYKLTESSSTLEDSLVNLLLGIGLNLLDDLEAAKPHQFFTLTNATFRCWPFLLILEASQVNALMDKLKRRINGLVPQKHHQVTYCGTDQPMDSKYEKDIGDTSRQQHQDYTKPKMGDEDVGGAAHEAEKGMAIMQLRQEIQDLKIEKQQMATDHAKVMREHSDDLNFMKTNWADGLRERDDLRKSLKESEAKQKDLKELLAEAEDKIDDMLGEGGGKKWPTPPLV